MVKVERTLSWEVLLAAVMTLAGWAFTAGVFYRELTDLTAQQKAAEEREMRLEDKLDKAQEKLEKMQTWVNAVSADNERRK